MVDVGVPVNSPFSPKIKVIGVGGAGCNAIENMIESGLTGVDFIGANTDAQALERMKCENKIQLGVQLTRGLGAGACPTVGELAAEESREFFSSIAQDSDMIFITAGMGGGTGTGAAPSIAKYIKSFVDKNNANAPDSQALDLNNNNGISKNASNSLIVGKKEILIVGVVTTPFDFEGSKRMNTAQKGIQKMSQYVDTLIVIPNQNLFRVITECTTAPQAFKKADSVMTNAVGGVSGIIKNPALINVDFADIRTTLAEKGHAMFGIGVASGPDRAIVAAESAIFNPLLDRVSMKGARGVLVHIAGGEDMTLFEIDIIVNRVKKELSQDDSEINIIFGATFLKDSDGSVTVYVVATGIGSEEKASISNSATNEEKEMINNNRSSSSQSTNALNINLYEENSAGQKNKEPLDEELVLANSGEILKKSEQQSSNLNNSNCKSSQNTLSFSDCPGSNNNILEIPAYLRRRKK